MHPRLWHSVSQIAPPSDVDLLVCYDPRHLLRPILIARFDRGCWNSAGAIVPRPLYWMALPDVPMALKGGR